MYREDWLENQFRRAAEAIARLVRGERVPTEELEASLREVAGLDPRTLDALPAEALAGLLISDDPRTAARAEAVARLLDALATPGDGRAAKAEALRGLVRARS